MTKHQAVKVEAGWWRYRGYALIRQWRSVDGRKYHDWHLVGVLKPGDPEWFPTRTDAMTWIDRKSNSRQVVRIRGGHYRYRGYELVYDTYAWRIRQNYRWADPHWYKRLRDARAAVDERLDKGRR